MRCFLISPIAKSRGEAWAVFLEQSTCLGLIIVVASSLAYGTSLALIDGDPALATQSRQRTSVDDRTAISSQEFSGFRSTLQGVHSDGAGLLITTAKGSASADRAREQDNTTVLPESGTGILLSIALFAAVGAARRLDRRRCIAVNARQVALATHHKEAAPDMPPDSPQLPTWLEFGSCRYPAG